MTILVSNLIQNNLYIKAFPSNVKENHSKNDQNEREDRQTISTSCHESFNLRDFINKNKNKIKSQYVCYLFIELCFMKI